jgi:hypothetical protein
VLSWVGFQMMPDGTSRIYLVTTNPVSHELKGSGDLTLVVELARTRVRLKNNMRRIDASHFSTPVRLIRSANGRGRKARVRIDLKEPVSPTVERIGDFLFLSFPASSFEGGKSSVTPPHLRKERRPVLRVRPLKR